MAAKVIAIINQKGGVGKTTTTFEVCSIFKSLNYKVLAIDMDPQCSLSSLMKADLKAYSILDVMLGNCEAQHIIQHCKYGDILISNGNLASYEKRFTGKAREYRLKEVIAPLLDQYDYIFIDSPPALGILTVGLLTASDGFVIPAAADIFSLEGIKQINETYKAVKAYTNPDLQIYGVLLTRYNFEFDKKVYALIYGLCKKLNIELFPTIISESVEVRESLVYSKGLLDYAPKSDAFKSYMLFVKYLAKKAKGGQH